MCLSPPLARSVKRPFKATTVLPGQRSTPWPGDVAQTDQGVPHTGIQMLEAVFPASRVAGRREWQKPPTREEWRAPVVQSRRSAPTSDPTSGRTAVAADLVQEGRGATTPLTADATSTRDGARARASRGNTVLTTACASVAHNPLLPGELGGPYVPVGMSVRQGQSSSPDNSAASSAWACARLALASRFRCRWWASTRVLPSCRSYTTLRRTPA